MLQSITITGLRWFQKLHENTYYTADIVVDGKLVHRMPEEYGHGDRYEAAAWEWLASVIFSIEYLAFARPS